jgi:hypothetical protein
LGVLDTTLCDTVCQWLAAGRWFSPGTPVSPTNKTDRHDILTEILLNGALNTINYLSQQSSFIFIEQCLCIAFNIIWTPNSQKGCPFITDSLREYTHTRKNCFRCLKLMSPLNAAICTTISYTLWVEWYYPKNNYLTLRSNVKVTRRSLRYATHRLMVMHPHTKYNWPIWKDKKVMVRKSFAEKKQKKQKKRKKRKRKRKKKIRLKQYVSPLNKHIL